MGYEITERVTGTNSAVRLPAAAEEAAALRRDRDRRRARLVVASRATDGDEARELLAMLGLMQREDEET